MNRWRRREDGAAAVELALVLPLLFALVFGIIEFGFVFNRWITVTHAAREGVRQLAVTDPSVTDPFADAEQKAEAAAPDLGDNVECSAAEPIEDQMQMTCETTYDLKLFVIDRDVTVRSRARMSRE